LFPYAVQLGPLSQTSDDGSQFQASNFPGRYNINRQMQGKVGSSTVEWASETLREAQAELAHVNRVATMGQLTASVGHEVNLPIAAALTNAQAAEPMR
jgi:C4-dicarboxylate-specific signal transduction histidine kinase